ncbi:MAG: hypothetical protein PHI28_18710 [Mangrovibacterium sp.]|nr:hypothetical protein [Mangrovibacterium sp.]
MRNGAWFTNDGFAGDEGMRRMQYTSRSAETAQVWQDDVRSKLFGLLS